MTLQQLLFVVETAKAGSISKAARSLHISQPSLSKAIQGLEDEFQIILFKRHEKGVTLTTDGAEFLQYATSVLSQCNDIKLRYSSPQNGRPAIRLSTNRLTFVTETLLDFYNDRLRNEESFSISIREIAPQLIYHDILEGRANMAVISLSKDKSAFWKAFLKSQNIGATLLFRSEKCILMHKDHPLRSLKRLSFDDLKKYPLIQALEDSPDSLNFRQEIEHLKYKEFPKLIYAGDRSLVSSFLNATDAIYFTTSRLKSRRFYPNIVWKPFPDDMPPMIWEFFLLKLKSKRLPAIEKEFEEYLLHVCRSQEQEIKRA